MSGLKPLLQLTSVTKSFGAVRALRGVSFDLRAGEVHALLGENGAGKSTLIKVVTGAHEPDGGSIEVFGQPVRHLTPAAAHRLGISCIYQQPALFPDLAVAENIGLRLEPSRAWRRVHWRQRRARAGELLRRVGAGFNVETEVRHLSMPEQQLVEIACALGAGSRVVIMDEPTASLTGREQALLFDAVRELRRTGVGVVYISHRLEEIAALAQRVTVLRDGQSMGTFAVRAGHAPAASADRAPAGADDESPVMDEPGLIRLMVGRELALEYPPAQGSPGDPVLELRRVGCSAGGVNDVSLEVRRGEIVGLAGLVGAGRTELARVLFGLTPADRGEIRLSGRPVSIESPASAIALGIAYVPEDRRRHGIILEMSVAQNMTMAVHRRLFPWSWLRPRAERQLALEYMGSLGVKAESPGAPGASLSGGNQQKTALARWLATRPSLLILDEPTQGVDIGAKSEIHRLIRDLAGQGMAVLIISSDLPEVLGLSDRIAVMRGGTMTRTLPKNATAHEVMAAALGNLKSQI